MNPAGTGTGLVTLPWNDGPSSGHKDVQTVTGHAPSPEILTLFPGEFRSLAMGFGVSRRDQAAEEFGTPFGRSSR